MPKNTEYVEISIGKSLNNPIVVISNIYANIPYITYGISYVSETGFRVYPYDVVRNKLPDVDADFYWIAVSKRAASQSALLPTD